MARTEADIVKDFENLGYKYKQTIGFMLNCISFTKNTKASFEVIEINTIEKKYRKHTGDFEMASLSITMQEHKLLNELFSCWRWI